MNLAVRSIDDTAQWLPYNPVSSHNHWRIVSYKELMEAENVIFLENASEVLPRLPTVEDLQKWRNVHSEYCGAFSDYLDELGMDEEARKREVETYASLVDEE